MLDIVMIVMRMIVNYNYYYETKNVFYDFTFNFTWKAAVSGLRVLCQVL